MHVGGETLLAFFRESHAPMRFGRSMRPQCVESGLLTTSVSGSKVFPKVGEGQNASYQGDSQLP